MTTGVATLVVVFKCQFWHFPEVSFGIFGVVSKHRYNRYLDAFHRFSKVFCDVVPVFSSSGDVATIGFVTLTVGFRSVTLNSTRNLAYGKYSASRKRNINRHRDTRRRFSYFDSICFLTYAPEIFLLRNCDFLSSYIPGSPIIHISSFIGVATGIRHTSYRWRHM